MPNPRRIYFHALAATLLWLGLGLGAISVFGALSPFAAGIWSDAEPMGIVFYAGAALCLAGLGVFSLAGPAALRFLGHPSVIVPAALGLWSLAAAALVNFPMLSIFGPPENSQGALWYIALAAFIASAMILRRNARAFFSVVVLAAAVSLGAAVLQLPRVEILAPLSALWHADLDTTLLPFNEYLAYYAIGLVPVAYSWLRQRHRIGGLLLLATAIVVLLVSRNRTGMIAVVAAFAIVASADGMLGDRFGVRNIARYLVNSRAAVVLAVLVCGTAPYLVIRLFPDLHDVSLTLWSRQIVFKGIEPSLFDGFTATLAGHGWGHYAAYLVRNLPSTGVALYNSQWGALERDLFHSHNALLEALFAVGLPGLVLAAAIPIAAALGAQRRWRGIAVAFALSWALIDAFWFMMPATMVALALATGLLAETSQAMRIRLNARIVGIGLCLSAIVLATVTVTLRRYDTAMTRLANCLPPQVARDACGALSVPVDPRGADLDLAALVESSVPAALQSLGKMPEQQLALSRTLLQAARAKETKRNSLLLSMALANAYAAIALAPDGQSLLPPGEPLATVWPDVLDRILALAPSRLDVVSTYFNWLIAMHQSEAMQRMLATASQIDPMHPVVLWFTGATLLDSADAARRREGIVLMRRAEAAGLGRFMPIDASVKAALDKAVE